MKVPAITPAHIEWGEDGEPPRARDYDDLYHARIGAFAQARHVFIAGNGLPGRWARCDDFTILETGFGLGNNFLATWAAWRDDAARPRRLHYVAVERHPPMPADLARAHAASTEPALAEELLSRWPAAVAGLHPIDLADGRVRLLLALGDIEALLPQLACRAQAIYLDGFAPARNPSMWSRRVLKALARHAEPGATAATWSVAREVRDGLVEAGFEVTTLAGIGGKRGMLQARLAPRPRGAHAVAPTIDPGARQAIVVGAGLAGAAAAHGLADLGFEVTVLDRAAAPASGASGNPAGLYHATIHRDDGPYARLFRAGALLTHRWARQLAAGDPRAASPFGLLRLEPEGDPIAMSGLLARLGWPEAVVSALDGAQASQAAGVRVAHAAWWHRAAGWIDPGALVRAQLGHPRITVRCETMVASIRRHEGHWLALGASGERLARAPLLVLANAEGLQTLLATAGLSGWASRVSRGQLSRFAAVETLALPVAGGGYALPHPDGLICGATDADAEGEAEQPLALRDDDHRRNFERLRAMTGIEAPLDPALWQGRAALRVQTEDRLPVAGAAVSPPSLPAAPSGPPRLDQVHLVPRVPGLFVLGALGGRGLTLAPLLGRLVASQAAGMPWPVERSLAAAVDPARWTVRAARRTASR